MIILSTNATYSSDLKKVVSDFGHGENIHCGREISPPPFELRHFFAPNISKYRH